MRSLICNLLVGEYFAWLWRIWVLWSLSRILQGLSLAWGMVGVSGPPPFLVLYNFEVSLSSPLCGVGFGVLSVQASGGGGALLRAQVCRACPSGERLTCRAI